jgi:uncharacterized coiled-coil protein SlyX
LLSNEIAYVETQLRLTKQELQISKTQDGIGPSARKKASHQRKSSEPFTFKKPTAFDIEAGMRKQVKSLHELAATQERTIQKCVDSLHKKRETIARCKLQIRSFTEENANLSNIGAKSRALLDTSLILEEFENEDDPFFVRTSQSTNGSPAPFYRQAQSVSLLNELSITVHDFTEENTFNFDKANEITSQSPNESHIVFLSPLIRPNEHDQSDLPDLDLQDHSCFEIKQLLTSTHDLLLDLPLKVESFKRMRMRPKAMSKPCLLSRLTQSQLFKVKV